MWKKISPLMLVILCIASGSFAQQGSNGYCKMVWNDEFSGPTLNPAIWEIEQTCNGGGNGELQCYTARPQNVFFQNGNLVLRAIKEQYTGTQAGCTGTDGCTNTKQFTSGRINSHKGASFLRGRMEIRAKLTSGSHIWPAIWMLPTDYSYGGWAASGEIDIMEQKGNHPTIMSGTLHHGSAWPNNIWTTNGDHSFNNQDLSQGYHVYSVEWTESTMKWYTDNENFQTLDMNRWWYKSPTQNPYTAMGQPWDKRFHFVFNVAVGGNFFGGYPDLTDADVAQWKVPEMSIDYVRVYEYTGGVCAQANVTTGVPTSAAATASQKSSNAASATASTGANGTDGLVDEQSAEGTFSAKTVIAISASVGGVALLLGIAGIVIGVILIMKARSNLMLPTLTPSSSQGPLTVTIS